MQAFKNLPLKNTLAYFGSPLPSAMKENSFITFTPGVAYFTVEHQWSPSATEVRPMRIYHPVNGMVAV